ncbi:hypothetical protein [Mycobacterium sp.]|uniref:hypothetical protein n=1 Tax=Mycobacterium sp. TaxID=1785 RepID=UPI003F9D7488
MSSSILSSPSRARTAQRGIDQRGHVTTYTLSDDPYAAILRGGGPRPGMITAEQVAAEVADAAEKPQLPLRIPIGDAARALLTARHTAPDDVPFLTTTTVD